jgi:hypothetical protein
MVRTRTEAKDERRTTSADSKVFVGVQRANKEPRQNSREKRIR